MGRPRAWFHVLLALGDSAAHGAEIRRRVAAITEGDVALYPVTLYGTLDALVDDGLIRELKTAEEGRPDDPNPRLRYYGLTAEGRTELGHEAAKMEALTRRAREILMEPEAS